MVRNGLIKILETILRWNICENCDIDLIYTLAWSRHMPKNKQLTPPLYRDLLDFYVCEIYAFVN